MTIETERLRLRAFEIADAEWFFKVTYNDDEMRKYLPGAYTRSLNGVKNSIRYYYSKGDFIHNFYFIIETKNHERCGFLNITQGRHKELGVAMFMAKEYRRKGYMIEALKGFISYLPAGRVLEFCIDKENESSLIVTQKLEQIVETTSLYPKNLTEESRFFTLKI